jgi:hypothetical protein
MGESALPPYTGVRSERVSCLGLISLRRREASSDHKGELEDRSVQVEELCRREEERCSFPRR